MTEKELDEAIAEVRRCYTEAANLSYRVGQMENSMEMLLQFLERQRAKEYAIGNLEEAIRDEPADIST